MLPAIARRSETPFAQIANDFGMSDAVIGRWLAKADVEDGLKPATAEWGQRNFGKQINVLACWR
ncbi:unannotated protein [freshwater metagenome]|uniref:Unannotated protein n=1 Tax=freshwater metagenome TaxID=449393 RepID=A0A6J7A457_9ZZZZ